jgi:DNA-binding NarL/FixJ family response regulator
MQTNLEQQARVITVLLVDAHPIFRAGVASLLDADAELALVGQAGDARTALTLVAQLRPDVVILDLSLPDTRGQGVATELLAAAPNLKIVGLSAKREPGGTQRLLSEGGRGCVLKTIACAELARTIKVVARGGTYVDPAVALPLPKAPATSHVAASGGLSSRELQVMRLVAGGGTAKEVADELGLSPRTLETYKARAMAKLNLRTRADLIRYAFRCGWLSASCS